MVGGLRRALEILHVLLELRPPNLLALTAMAERHVGYGVYPSHYQAFVTTMVDTLRELLGSAWTADVENAWHNGLEAITASRMRAPQAVASRSAVKAAPLCGTARCR